MANNDESSPPFPGGHGGGTGGTAGADRASGCSFQVPQGNSPTVGTLATPMFFQSVSTPKTTTITPYRNFLNILSTDQKLLWSEMVKDSNDHVLLDMNVTNSKAIVDLFQDRVIIF